MADLKGTGQKSVFPVNNYDALKYITAVSQNVHQIQWNSIWINQDGYFDNFFNSTVFWKAKLMALKFKSQKNSTNSDFTGRQSELVSGSNAEFGASSFPLFVLVEISVRFIQWSPLFTGLQLHPEWHKWYIPCLREVCPHLDKSRPCLCLGTVRVQIGIHVPHSEQVS